jgi:hypothetical protein
VDKTKEFSYSQLVDPQAFVAMYVFWKSLQEYAVGGSNN